MTAVLEQPVATSWTDEEIAEAMEKHEGVCWHFARMHCLPWDKENFEEMASVARLQLFICAKHFDPSRGNRFSTYYYPSVRAAVAIAAKKNIYRGVTIPTQKHVPVPFGPTRTKSFRATKGYDTGHHHESSDHNDPPDRPHEEPLEVPPEFWDRINRILTTDQAEVLRRYFTTGESMRAIAEAVGCGKQNVSAHVVRAIHRLRQYGSGLREYLIDKE